MPERVRHIVLRGPFYNIFRVEQAESLLAGPAGTGKTTAALFYCHLTALKYPGLRVLFVRKTLDSLTKSTLVTYQEFVANDAIATGAVTYFGGSLREAPGFRYINGSRITLAGMDNPERVKSTEYDVIFVDEATELASKDWQTLLSRLRGSVLPKPRIIGACNPTTPQHWLKLRCDAGRTKLLETRHEHNPAYYDESGEMTHAGRNYIDILDNLTGLEHKRLRLGLWAAADGIIYDDFDPAVHVIPHREIPDDWDRYWAVDFGFDHPLCWQSWAVDPDGKLYLYREWLMSNMIVEDHAQVMLDTCTRPGDPDKGEPERVWLEPKPVAVICDHDAEDRATLSKHLGIRTTSAKKEVLRGIQCVASRLKSRRLFIVEGYRMRQDQRLVDKKKPTCLTEEIPGYVWDNSKGADDKERPVKVDDHSADTMRYMVSHMDNRRVPSVRWLRAAA